MDKLVKCLLGVNVSLGGLRYFWLKLELWLKTAHARALEELGQGKDLLFVNIFLHRLCKNGFDTEF